MDANEIVNCGVDRETKLLVFSFTSSLDSCFCLFLPFVVFIERRSMQGVKRVFAFCCLTAVFPALLIICPLYLKHQVFKEIKYTVAESDILEVRDGISTVFCQEHVLKMNTSFNAFQLNHMPKMSKTRKHIRLKKSMELPDDTLEYWGFFLMKGATVELKVCSRFSGSRILVVKGERNLRTCGLMEHNLNKYGANYNAEQSQVKVTFETVAEIVDSDEISLKEQNMKYMAQSDTDDEAMLNNGGEDFSDDFDDGARKKHKEFAASNLKAEKSEIPSTSTNTVDEKTEYEENQLFESSTKKHHKRHKLHDKHREVPDNADDQKLENFRRRRSHKHNTKADNHNVHEPRAKRDTILDGGVNHGGNAKTYQRKNESDSISSFENALFECYDGQILVAKGFEPSTSCTEVKALEQGSHLISTHDVNSDGYYYYIFYSDNDDAVNPIHAVFDIYKPTYLYSNISETKGCINSTECRFPIQM